MKPESARERYDAGATQGTPKDKLNTNKGCLAVIGSPPGAAVAHIWIVGLDVKRFSDLILKLLRKIDRAAPK